ncbi:MAG: hypothetical protein INH41_27205 [Myxococcaceae bacterium]|jgi:predicted metal-dependent HD superfamily phosphohydrolase|nr:hypothetical protein [Myxococcaceae bacterium]MCA3016089.1 hypothetical protein [Myxococcaceae bacterium]
MASTFAPLTVPEGLMRVVTTAYAEPPCAYHTIAHVQVVLGPLATVPGWSHPREAFLAALVLDAIDVAGRKDNEARSADLAADEHRPVAGALLDRLGRRRFLAKRLSAQRLSPSAHFHQRFDAQARANLRRALGCE